MVEREPVGEVREPGDKVHGVDGADDGDARGRGRPVVEVVQRVDEVLVPRPCRADQDRTDRPQCFKCAAQSEVCVCVCVCVCWACGGGRGEGCERKADTPELYVDLSSKH